MTQSYKVFFREKMIIITSDTAVAERDDKTILHRYESIGSLRKSFGDFQKNNGVRYLFVVTEPGYLEKLWEDFKDMFEIIHAAGGIVKNETDELLMIFRKKKWDLPKGKVEKGEKIERAAVREVEEECGISGVKIVKKIISTFHTYPFEGKNVLKETHWFEMKVDGVPVLHPQVEEDIAEARWMNEADVKKAMKNTYLTTEEVLKAMKS